MTKYLVDKTHSNTVVSFNEDTKNVAIVDSEYIIDYVYNITEDGEFETLEGKKIQVKAGDTMFKLYGIEKGTREWIVISNSEFADYFSRKKKFESEQKKCTER